MKRIIAGVALGTLAVGGTPAFAAACSARVCLRDFVKVVATDICEDGEDCDRYCAPFDDPIICFP